MRILHISYSLSCESAATRIAKSLDGESESFFYLGRKSKSDWVNKRSLYPHIGRVIGILFHIINIILSRIFLVNPKIIFSFSILPWLQRFIVNRIVKKYSIDYIFLHWGGFGFFSPNSIFDEDNTFIILHDYYQVTAGCHVPMGCHKFNTQCENCPLVKPIFSSFFYKYENEYKYVPLSSYSKSILNGNNNYRIIGNPLSDKLELFDIIESVNKYLALVVSNFYEISFVSIWKLDVDNKGYDVLLLIIKRLESLSKENNINIRVNLISGSEIKSEILDIRYYEYCNESDIITILSKSDLTVLPSKYETFSQVCLESICSGTPVVAYDLTGPKDIISNNYTGILVRSFCKEDFVNEVINNLSFKRNSISKNINFYHKTRIAFSQETIRKKYIQVINDESE
ncbi:glycosyltransferase [Aliivibrio fischeri]|uniref:glycosyltransferase n=1 Tax=Aliivibrio fischeri TaxID=668 RepID=UPI0012DA6A60|nr:glycosyltransferase [Aliivibrio fischeri]MUJ26414.1 glycosyltransferase [Aliivibrio fischeri]